MHLVVSIAPLHSRQQKTKMASVEATTEIGGGNDLKSPPTTSRTKGQKSSNSNSNSNSEMMMADAVVVDESSPGASSKPKASSPKRKKRKAMEHNHIKPSHILMSLSTTTSGASASSSSNEPPVLANETAAASSTMEHGEVDGHGVLLRCMDPHIQNDYIAKRRRIYERNTSSWNCTSQAAERSSSQTLPPSTTLIRHPWDGVSKAERALVECCELPMDMDMDGKAKNPKNEYGDIDLADSEEYIRQRIALSSSWSLGGVLSLEHEVRFAAVMASECHNVVSKSLALAILERTLEVYLREEAAAKEEEALKAKTVMMEDGGTEIGESGVPSESDITQSSRFTRIQNRRKLILEANEAKEDEFTSPASSSTESGFGKPRRLEWFLAAGGLKILNQWLADASGYDIVEVIEPTLAKPNKKSTANVPETVLKRKAPPTRPIVYTILRFLEHIPFDKDVVMKSKINKQVQKLGKRVASIMEANRTGKAPLEDLENWTTDRTLSHLEIFGQIRDSVSAIKSSWREKTSKESTSSETLADPFQSLQDLIKDRLQELTQFESGEGFAPEWYLEDPSPSTKSNAPAHKKLTKMQEMAANERKSEREKLQQKIKEVKKKNQASLALLKEKLRKQREDYGLSSLMAKKVESNGKRVCWKDGLDTQRMRHRRKLEEVFVYVKGTPSAGLGEIEDGQMAPNDADAHDDEIKTSDP